MALPSRTQFLSTLQSLQCDICYDNMLEPTRTPCGHVYCSECLLTWLHENNTCPTCRTKLFEQDDDDGLDDQMDDEMGEDDDGDEDDEVEEENDAYREWFASEVTARIIELDTGMERPAAHCIARTVTFDSTGMAALLAALRTNERDWPQWHDELDDWDVRYTFTVRVGYLARGAETWKFDYISYPTPSEPDTAMSVIREKAWVQAMAHIQWARKITGYLYRVPAIEVENAYQAQLRQGAVPEYRLIAYPRADNF